MKLYRGFRSTMPEGVYENDFRNSPRYPVDTPYAIHLLSDDWFFEKFGIRARSSTLICTTNISQAALYGKHGTIAEIIPIKPFNLIYSASVLDFLTIVTEIGDINKKEVSSVLDGKCYCIENELELVQDCLTEVMIDCSSYNIKHL